MTQNETVDQKETNEQMHPSVFSQVISHIPFALASLGSNMVSFRYPR